MGSLKATLSNFFLTVFTITLIFIFLFYFYFFKCFGLLICNDKESLSCTCYFAEKLNFFPHCEPWLSIVVGFLFLSSHMFKTLMSKLYAPASACILLFFLLFSSSLTFVLSLAIFLIYFILLTRHSLCHVKKLSWHFCLKFMNKLSCVMKT